MSLPARDVDAALRDVDTLGGFFTVATGPAEGVDPSWRPFEELRGDVLDARIDQVAEQLGGVPRRIAASLLSLSISARVTALLLGAGALHGVVPRLHDDLRWRPWSGGPMPLWIDRPRTVVVGNPGTHAGTHPGTHGDAQAETVADAASAELGATLRPVLDAVAAQASVSDQVLWGNVASSLGGALRMLLTERPAARDPVLALGTAMSARPPLVDLGEFVDDPRHPTGIAFARRTCCLFYRVPGGGTCGDCVLERPR